MSAEELPITSMTQALSQAGSSIRSYLQGTVPVLKTRWSKINKSLLGGFQFGMLYVVAGASGHGKSMFMNNLIRDFTSPAYNADKPIKILHFSFEMSAEMEILRRVSSLSKVGLDKMLQADEPVSDIEQVLIQEKLQQINEPNIHFVEKPGNRMQIHKAIMTFMSDNPGHKYVVCLDHTLLVTGMPGESEIDTLANLGKMFIEMRKKYGIMFIVLSQLNDKIESEQRRNPDAPALHYPIKTDIHGSKQLYHAADVVMVLHQPQLLGLVYYGRNNIPTQNLVALHCLKNRHGQASIVLLKNNLRHGTFDDWDSPDTTGARRPTYG